VDIESTVNSIQRAVEEAELMAGCEIRSVYASISGSHTQCKNSPGIVPIKDGEVTYGDMERVLENIYEMSGQKVSIVGWSLGGVFARELAKLHPDMVRQATSLGSPIHDDRRHTNASRLFEFLNGKDPEPVKHGHFTGLDLAPPVPTTSILTRTGGLVPWPRSVQYPH